MHGFIITKKRFMMFFSEGSVSHIFPTDVLNAVLYMEMALRAEIKKFKTEMG